MRPSTTSCTIRSWIVAVILFALCLVMSSIATAQVHGYDPGLGTLPEAQGWPRDGNGAPPEPVVVGGVLMQGPTGLEERQRWSQVSPTAFDFTTGFTLDFDLKVVSSGFVTTGANQ
jgi:hypothetical protein